MKMEFDVNDFDRKVALRAEEIVLRFDREIITTADMLMLGLNAQNKRFRKRESILRKEIILNNDAFDKMMRFLKWQGGALLALTVAVYLELFLG